MKIALYRKMPQRVQGLIRRVYSLLPVERRMGSTYRAMKKFLRESSTWEKKEIERWQLEKLKAIIRHAYETVPGYRELYRQARVEPEALRSLDEIKYLPFVTKELLRDNVEEFSSRDVPRASRLYRTTGGSTGIPFGFYLLQADIERELAFLHSAWDRVGWKLGDSSAVLRGAFVGSEEKFWEYDPFLNELRLSSYYVAPSTYPRYKRKIVESAPDHLQAYPSAATIFSDLVLQNNDAGAFPFRLLLLGSENLYDWQKQKLGRAFPRSKLFGWYGHAEQVLFAPMCESSEAYHLDPFYGIAEVLNERNEEVKPGSSGELVGTSLWNYATPFIRYRTMDMATTGGFGCPSCGRHFRLLEKIDGRLQELIVTRTGRFLSMTQINMHSGVFDNIKQFQFHQRDAGKLTFNIVRGDAYSDRDTLIIRDELQKKLGDDVELTIGFVDAIIRPQSGKFRFLIQELPVEYADRIPGRSI